MATTKDETTMSVQRADGTMTEPVPLSALERASGQFTLFEGQRYPDVEIKLTGGVEGMTEMVLPDVTAKRNGDRFTLVVHGIVVSKKHAIKFDKEGDEIRTLVVTLKADDMHLVDEPE